MTHVPQGELAIQTLAMPSDTNPNGDIFGGWVVSQMDLAAGILAKKHSEGRAVTVAIDSMSFLLPVHVGDVVSCYVRLEHEGKTSMTIKVEVWTNVVETGLQSQVTEGTFTFVAINEQGKPRQIKAGL
ncbi:MAG: acyl-CoA thioesterase [Legionellaceae bacterium]|nr:acyl-CoA thioesterase [Legionellaceae bacterium]